MDESKKKSIHLGWFFLLFFFFLGFNKNTGFNLFDLEPVFSKAFKDTQFKDHSVSPLPQKDIVRNQKNERKDQEKVISTGSHFFKMSQTDVSRDLSIFVLNKEDLRESGHDFLSDVLKSHPFASFGAVREKSTFEDERGIPAKPLRVLETLVLLNGKRINRLNQDINLIPLALVERIEILNRGSSSIYGENAIRGVINIITRKPFQGLSLDVYHNFIAADIGNRKLKRRRGEQGSLSFYTGFKLKSSSLFSVLNYQDKNEIGSLDKKYRWGKPIKKEGKFLKGYSPFGSPFSFSRVEKRGEDEIKQFNDSLDCGEKDWNCLSRQYRQEGLFKASSDCDPEWVGKDERGNEFCYFKSAYLRDEQPSIKNISYLADFKTEISPTIQVGAQFFMQFRSMRFQLEPPLIRGVFRNFLKTQEQNQTRISKDDFIYLHYSPRHFANLSHRRAKQNTKSSMGVLEFEKKITEDLNLKVEFLATFRSFLSQTKGLVDTHRLKEAMASNEYSLNQKIEAENQVFPYTHTGKTENKTSQYVFNSYLVSKNLAQSKYGLIEGAFGVGSYHLAVQNSVDDQIKARHIEGGFSDLEYSKKRNAFNTYFEFLIPLFLNGTSKFSIRYDTFSDLKKENLSPDLNFYFSPFSWLHLTSSFGKSFSTPLLSLSEFSSFEDEFFLQDIKYCKDQNIDVCKANSYKVLMEPYSGSLKTSRADSFDLGAYVHRQKWRGGFRYWYTHLEGETIYGKKLSQELLVLENKIGRDQLQEKYGAYIGRSEEGGLSFMKISPLSQLNSKVYGLDFSFKTHFRLFKLNIDLQEVHTLVLNRKEGLSGFERNVFKDQTRVGIPYSRNLIRFRFSKKGPWSLTYSANTIGENRRNSKSFRGFYTFHDIYFTFKSRKRGEFSFGVDNLHNSIPLAHSDLELNEHFDLYESTGLTFYFRYSHFFKMR